MLFKKKERNETLDDVQEDFYNFGITNFIKDDNNETDYLPIPVVSFIQLNTGIQFIHHLLLSMGRYSTEIDLILHASIRESFRYAKLIGDLNNEDDLQNYSNQLLYKWIEYQL